MPSVVEVIHVKHCYWLTAIMPVTCPTPKFLSAIVYDVTLNAWCNLEHLI